MTKMNVSIPDDIYQKLQERAHAQQRDLAAIIVEILDSNLLPAPRHVDASKLSNDERLRAFLDYQEWVQGRPKIDVELDVSRESIYEGRGE